MAPAALKRKGMVASSSDLRLSTNILYYKYRHYRNRIASSLWDDSSRRGAYNSLEQYIVRVDYFSARGAPFSESEH